MLIISKTPGSYLVHSLGVEDTNVRGSDNCTRIVPDHRNRTTTTTLDDFINRNEQSIR
jgi:hypothetical protein